MLFRWVRDGLDMLPGGDDFLSPGPCGGDFQGSAASAADKAGAGVQDAAQRLRLGPGEVAVQGQELQPGQQDGRGRRHHARSSASSSRTAWISAWYSGMAARQGDCSRSSSRTDGGSLHSSSALSAQTEPEPASCRATSVPLTSVTGGYSWSLAEQASSVQAYLQEELFKFPN